MAKGSFLTKDDILKIRTLIKQNETKTLEKRSKATVLLPKVITALGRKISLSVLQREMAGVRKVMETYHDDRLKPWSLGSMSQYPQYLPPDFAPVLMGFQVECMTSEKKGEEPTQLTIWEAIWIVRLHKLFEHSKASVLDAAIWYALYEQMWELSQTPKNTSPCDTTPFDDIDGDKIMENINAYFFGSDTESSDDE